MRNNVLLKLIVVAFLGVAFMIPLGMIWGVVAERARYRDRVTAEVAQSTASAQAVVGPVLAVRYRERVRSAAPSDPARAAEVPTAERVHVLLPDSLAIRSKVSVEQRSKGIYEVPVYRAVNQLAASFRIPPRFGIDGAAEIVGEPSVVVAVGVTDSRGLRDITARRQGGAALEVAPGSGLALSQQGFSMSLSDAVPGSTLGLDLALELVGTDRLTFLPVGKKTEVTMESDWAHPGFTGGFLPDERTVSRDGFSASWGLTHLATGVNEPIAKVLAGQLDALEGKDLGVRFIQPVDVYQQSERAVKYGGLFVVLTFVAFLLFEVLRRLEIHPVQYALCAAALVLFFLLVVSLSEHVPFHLAYLAASGACVGLLTFYVVHVLRSLARGLSFGLLLSSLYGVLYVILLSEDYALLLGTLLLFTVLTVVMIMTRRVDWYRIGAGAAKDQPSGGTA
jgi:inner membrane protein